MAKLNPRSVNPGEVEMRVVAAGVLVATMLGATAFAQTDFEGQHQLRMTRSGAATGAPGPLASLNKDSRDWIAAETQRQIDNPRPVEVLSVAVDFELHKDEIRVARMHRLNTVDIVRAVTLQITTAAEDAAKKALQDAQASGDVAAAKAASEKLALATVNRKAAAGLQTEESRALAGL
jgi:hypothetical protein